MSTLSVETIKSLAASTPPVVQDSGGTQIGTFCRAWVNFNGTGTVAIRASFNISSITDNGAGQYTANITTAMPDANYSAVGSCSYDSNDAIAVQTNAYLTTSLGISTVKANLGSFLDKTFINVAIFR